jgi:hypothetical protein
VKERALSLGASRSIVGRAVTNEAERSVRRKPNALIERDPALIGRISEKANGLMLPQQTLAQIFQGCTAQAPPA